MIEAILERCAGIDVGKKFVVVCVMTGGAKDEPHTQIKKFGTIVSELQRLAEWLVAEGCTHAVMESAGSYWKPVFNLPFEKEHSASPHDSRPDCFHKTQPPQAAPGEPQSRPTSHCCTLPARPARHG